MYHGGVAQTMKYKIIILLTIALQGCIIIQDECSPSDKDYEYTETDCYDTTERVRVCNRYNCWSETREVRVCDEYHVCSESWSVRNQVARAY